MKVALTGATGFIGSYIARGLRRADIEVRAMVRTGSNTGPLEAIGAELFVGDFAADASLRGLVADVDAVIHNGYWHDRNELQEPLKWMELNLLGSLKLLEFCRQAGISRYVFISSGAVYGGVRTFYEPRDEFHPCYPGGGYAAYNRAVELYVNAYRNEFDMTGSCSVRLCGRNVGVHPRSLKASAYFELVKKARAGEPLEVGGGEQFDSCRDIAANLRVLLGLERTEDVYNFCDEHFSMRVIAETIVEAVSSTSKVLETEPDSGIKRCSNDRILAAGGTFSGLEGLKGYVREVHGLLR